MNGSKARLDQELVRRKLTSTRSQAESYIKLGQVSVNGKRETKTGHMVSDNDKIKMTSSEQYVSRAGLKLASVAKGLKLDFKNKIVLDVGSSTGGFTDFALKHGAKKVIAVDVGTGQLHHTLLGHPKIELHEQTDIRDFPKPEDRIDIVLIDVSFISLRDVLPAIAKLVDSETQVIAMAKPQFEAGNLSQHKGVIKNEKIRRNTLKDLENWIQKLYKVIEKADSEVTGEKGNRERFYLLRLLPRVR